jgi:hypothetical protein
MLKVLRQLAAVVGVLGVLAAVVLLIPAVLAGRLPANFGAFAILGMLVALGCRVAYVKLGAAIRAQEAAELEQLRDITRFEVFGTPRLAAMLSLLLIATCALGLWRAATSHDWGIFAISASLCVVFGWTFVQAMGKAIRNRPMISMDLHGIELGTLRRFPWSDVIGMRHDQRKFRNRTIHRLVIGLRSPQRYLDRLPWLLRWQKRAWRTERPRYGAIEIPLNMLATRPEVVVEAARKLRARNPAPWLEHWHELFSAQEIDAFLATQEDMRIAQAAADRGDFAAAEAAAGRMEATSEPMAARAAEMVKRGKQKVVWARSGWSPSCSPGSH